MAGERRYSRIPPESTGNRLTVVPYTEIRYNNRVQPILEGITVTGVSSTASGTVSYHRPVDGTTGTLVITPDEATREDNKEFTLGENLQTDAVTIANVADTGYVLYAPSNVLASGDNPSHTQLIDGTGSAYVRFSDGPASLDTFGKLRISQETILGEHIFPAGNRDGEEWTSYDSAGGSVGYDTDAVSVLLSTPTTDGAIAQHTSDLFHHYFPGQSHHALMSVANGDTGKANVRRRWGYYTDANGVFFELNGTTMNVVIRSSVTGSVVDTIIPQSDWNVDTLLGGGGGSNSTVVALDPSAINLYYIDMAWLGAGVVEMGLVIGGTRIACHRNYNANINPRPWAQTASLPVRIEQKNTGPAGSSSEMRFTCAVVSTEHDVDPHNLGIPRSVTSDQGPDGTLGYSVDSSGNVPLMAIRNKMDDHSVGIPSQLHAFAMDSGGAADAFIRLNMYKDAGVSTSAPWQSPAPTADFEINFDLDSATFLEKNLIWTGLVSGASNLEGFRENFTYGANSLKGRADGSQRNYILCAQRLVKTTPARLTLSMVFNEVKN